MNRNDGQNRAFTFALILFALSLVPIACYLLPLLSQPVTNILDKNKTNQTKKDIHNGTIYISDPTLRFGESGH